MPPEFLGYEEFIERFTFREKCSIKIPKSVRERAFSFSLDIEIQSTDGQDYVNSKSIPAYGFYGYVVLVMRNFAEIQIPIKQPRQNIYYERLEDAYSNWYAFYLKFVTSFELSFINNESLVAIGTALGLTIGTPVGFCPTWSGFEEIPLREVYVKTRFGTRFALEVSWWQALEATYGECTYTPNSKQEDDPEKDNGLPPDGVQPSNNGFPSSPYDGFPTPSSPTDLGDFFNDDKLDGMDLPNPDNEPSELLWFLKVVSSIKRSHFPDGCAVRKITTSYILLAGEDVEWEVRPKPTFPATPTGCGGTTSRLQQIRLTGGDWFDYDFEDSDVALSIEKQSGYSLPPNSVEFV